MRPIHELRQVISTEHFPSAALTGILEKKSPAAKSMTQRTQQNMTIHRMIKAGEIVRVKRGLYVFGQAYQKQALSMFSLGNLVYGPSYVSLESALSFYGLIPEFVPVVTSAITKNTKKFKTTIGSFNYRKIPTEVFPIGVHAHEGQSGNFLIAIKEKALLDKIYLDGPRVDLARFTIESLRMEIEDLQALNRKSLLLIAERYSSKTFLKAVTQFVKSIFLS